MANKMGVSGIVLAVLFLAGGCAAPWHRAALHSTSEREMTVGVVQKEIRKGLSQADVAERLGSPNIVTRDSDGKETWVYDKIATEASYSTHSTLGMILWLNPIRSGGLAGQQSGGASASTQKTLTVVIKFDDAGLVDTFSYHASKF